MALLEYLIASDKGALKPRSFFLKPHFRRRFKVREKGIDLPFTTSYQKGNKMLLRVSMKDYLNRVDSYFEKLSEGHDSFSREHPRSLKKRNEVVFKEDLVSFPKVSNFMITSSMKKGVKTNQVDIFLKPCISFFSGTPDYVKNREIGRCFVKQKIKPQSICVPLKDFIYLLYDYLDLHNFIKRSFPFLPIKPESSIPSDENETSGLQVCQAYTLDKGHNTFCFFHDYDILTYHKALLAKEKEQEMKNLVWGFKD